MARVSTLLLFVLACLAFTAITSAQDGFSPAQAIGQRVKLIVKYRNEEGEFTCVGKVVQVDQDKLILEDVTKTEATMRGVPFLSNQNQKKNERLFTNVGLDKTTELEFGIVLPLERIKSCQLVELADDEKILEESHEILEKVLRIQEEMDRAVELLRKQRIKR